MNEAKGSWNGHYKSKAGNKDQFTLRQRPDETDDSFIVRIISFDALLQANGWRPWQQHEAGAPAQASPQTAPAEPAGGSTKSFAVESIQLAAGGENPRWVVKGGKFKKFGVTCWPEVLKEAGMLDHLDPMKLNHPQAKWLAFYSERTNDEGNLVPDKVTRMVRQG